MAIKVTNRNRVNLIIKYEDGSATIEEFFSLFGHLIETGLAYSLQGSYGRQAERLIGAGYISRKGMVYWSKVKKDYVLKDIA